MTFYKEFKNALDCLEKITDQEKEFLHIFRIDFVKELSPQKEFAYQRVAGLFELLKGDKSLLAQVSETLKMDLIAQLERVMDANAENSRRIDIHLEAKRSLIRSFKKSVVKDNFVTGTYNAFGRPKGINQKVATPAISVSMSKTY